MPGPSTPRGAIIALDLDASWAFGGHWIWMLPGPFGDMDLDASWALGGHWHFKGVQAGGSACPSGGSSCDWTQVWSHTGPGPDPAQRSRRILTWTRPAWRRCGGRECWSPPQRKLSWDSRPRAPRARSGGSPHQVLGTDAMGPRLSVHRRLRAGPPAEQGLDQYLLSE